MKRMVILSAILAGSAWAETVPVPSDLPKPVADKVRAAEKQLKNFDCPFLVQTYHPKDAKVNELGFCLYPLTVEQGIFSAITCVGVLIEPDTQTRNPFYGKSGHWGVEGNCETERLKKKFLDPDIDKTVNPITSLRIKRQEGIRLRLLRDDYKVWDVFEKRTEPNVRRSNLSRGN